MAKHENKYLDNIYGLDYFGEEGKNKYMSLWILKMIAKTKTNLDDWFRSYGSKKYPLGSLLWSGICTHKIPSGHFTLTKLIAVPV